MPEEQKQGLLRPRPLDVYHERTRRRGVNSFVYWTVRSLMKPAIIAYFRLRRLGREHIPSGGVILVAKRELFKNPVVGWFLNCMGAFPVKRGESDEESVRTALALLERGQAVVIFPEGTRITAGSLARP